MQQIKIIFFDIDGTLLDFGKKDLSPKTREALLKLRANGIRICIATGRSPLAVPKFEGVEFDDITIIKDNVYWSGIKY